MAEPAAEAEGEVEPEAQGEPENPGPEAEFASTEPEPHWPEAFKQWGPAWHLHVYPVASFFLIVAILTAISMTFYLRDKRLLKQGTLTFTLQCLLLYFTGARSLALFINPYQTVNDMKGPAFNMVWTFALPGLTASFSVLLLVFLDTTKMTLGPPVFQKLWVLLVFTACHFAIVVSSDVVCLYSAVCAPMILFCQILFIVYGGLLSAGYMYTAICLHRKCLSGVIIGEENKKIVRLVKISFCASAVAFSVSITHLYAACSDFGVYSDVMYVNAWKWWILQSILRLEEVTSCCLILLIAFRKPCIGPNNLISTISNHFSRKTHPTGLTHVKPIQQTAVTNCDIVSINNLTKDTKTTFVDKTS